jgi:hypothetical protein
MKAVRFALRSFSFVDLLATALIARNARAIVSGAGTDTNPCSVTALCRTFAHARSVTNTGGVSELTSAAYGPFGIPNHR